MTALRDAAAALRAQQPGRANRPAPVDRGKRLATIQRGDGEEVRVTWDEYEGRPFLSIRAWRNGYPDPKRGVTIRLRELADFADGIALALEEAKSLPAREVARPQRAAGGSSR